MEGISCRVLDLRWLVPLPVGDLVANAREVGRVVVVDETRHQGGVGEAVVTALVEGGFGGPITRVAARDSFVPLGDAANLVLVSEDDIADAVRAIRRVNAIDAAAGPVGACALLRREQRALRRASVERAGRRLRTTTQQRRLIPRSTPLPPGAVR